MAEKRAAGIILAAGRGSRMKELTADRPKCMLELAGRPLLHWQLGAMRDAGIDKILVVRGYAGHCLRGNFDSVENSRWASTNMLSSLLCAQNFADDFFASGGRRLLVSYSDIVWRSKHARELMKTNFHIAIASDLLWENLWRLRFENPLSDAETFMQENGLLREIGRKTDDISKIRGQYMGLVCFDKNGWQTLLDKAAELGREVDQTDMTAFLRFLLSRQIPIGVAPVQGGWCECDNADDIQKYEKALTSGCWSHDWRK